MDRVLPSVSISLALAAASWAGDPPSPADDAYQAAANLFAGGRYAEAAEAYSAFPKAHSADARAAEARFMAAESLFRAGRRPESIEAFAALRADPRAALREANALYILGRPADALPRLRELVSRKGLPATLAGPARYFLARSLVALGKLDEARKALAAAPKPPPAPARPYLAAALGDVEAAAFLAPKGKGGGDPKRLDAALAAYREALDARGDVVPDVLFKMGELLRRAGKPAEAVPCYRRAADGFASSPVAPHARLGLAWSALGAGDAATAAREAARLRAEARDGALAAEARFAEGTALLAVARYSDAADALELLTRKNTEGGPKDVPIPRDRVLRRTAWAAVAAGRKDLAARAASDLLALKLPAGRAAEAHLLAAEADLASGKPAEAVAHLDAAKGGGARLDALASYRLAVALDMKGDAGAAAAAFVSFRKSYPKHPLVPWAAALAGRAYLAGGRPAEAAKCFRTAREHFGGRPEEPEILWGSTVAEYRLGSFVSMAGFARRIVEGHPTSPRAADAAYWLGWWHLERGELARSAERFRDAAGLAVKGGRKKLAALATLEAASAAEKSGDGGGALRTARELVTGPLAAHAPAEAVLWVAEALRDEGKTEEARRLLDGSLARVGDGAERARLLYALGELARAKGRTAPALAFFEKAISAGPPPDLRAAALLGKARCLVATGSRREVEVILQNVIDRTAGWPRATAYVELGKLRLEEASELEGRNRAALAERAARDFMLVAVLYVPEARGEGSRLSAQALLGAARAYALLGRYVAARDRLEELLAKPLLRAGPDGKETPEAVEARKILEEVGLKASGVRAGGADGGAADGAEEEKPAAGQGDAE
jgi:TolA-binding protein